MSEHHAPPPQGQGSDSPGPIEPPGTSPMLILGIVAALALAGFVTGTRTPARGKGYRPPPASRDQSSAAPSYADLRKRRFGPDAGMYEQQLRDLTLQQPVDGADLAPATAAERSAALDERARRRAYDGAPPVIPHAIDQRGLPPCLACHLAPTVAAGKVAPTMSHRQLDNCAQCHVPAAAPAPLAVTQPVDNTFAGLFHAGGGRRAWPGAPPVMPHSGWMRETCPSCHGPLMRPGLRTSHPQRSSCNQCHAPSARLDQGQFSDAGSSQL